MENTLEYRTRQRDAVAAYLASQTDGYVTAYQVYEYFRQSAQPVGLATVYRSLDRLVTVGKAKKLTISGISGACYQYIGDEDTGGRYHFKCEACGLMYSINCSVLDGLQQHISSEHHFEIDLGKTVFYGRCPHCLEK